MPAGEAIPRFLQLKTCSATFSVKTLLAAISICQQKRCLMLWRPGTLGTSLVTLAYSAELPMTVHDMEYGRSLRLHQESLC